MDALSKRRTRDPIPFALRLRSLGSFMLYSRETYTENEAIWMLDSGASWHFTYDTNDFVELEAITPLPIYTANGQTEITGKGTVIFTVDGSTIRVYPIYYIPDVKTCLLSLGQFLQSGLHSRGSARDITLYKGQDEFLAFHPR